MGEAGAAFTPERLALAKLTQTQVVKAINDALDRGVPMTFIIDRFEYTATKIAYKDIQEEGKAVPTPGPAAKPTVSTEGLPTSLMVPYTGVSKGYSLKLVAPRNIATQMQAAQMALERETGMSIDAYLASKLGRDVKTLQSQLAGAQIDTAALAIRNIERESALSVPMKRCGQGACGGGHH